MEKTNTHTASRLASVILAGATLMPLASGQELSYEELAQRELLRRREAVQNSDKLVLEAREAYTNDDFETSVAKYRQAIGELPNGRVMEPRRAHLNDALAQATVALSKTLVRRGDNQGTEEVLTQVLEIDPDNAAAQRELDNFYDPIRTNPSGSVEHTTKVDEVRRGLYKAIGFYELGDYDKAIEEYDKVLLIDPYNQAARRGQQTVHEARRNYYQASYDETRARLLTEVDRAWEIVPVPVVDFSPGGNNVITDPADSTGKISITRKLNTIIIPVFDLENTTLTSAISRLNTAIRDNDPEPKEENKGVSFVIRRSEVAGTAEEGAIDAPDIRIDQLSLRNVPASEVLSQICKKCNPAMRYKVEEYVVAVVEASSNISQDHFNRSYQVPPDFVSRLGGGADISAVAEGGNNLFGEDETDGGDSADEPADKLQTIFNTMGVEFQGKASVRFVRATSTLFVTNTAVELDKMEAIIENIRGLVPKQIRITTKFIEVNQQDSDELGFDWVVSPFGLTANSVFLGGGTAGNGIARTADNFAGVVGRSTIAGIPADGGNVFNTLTSGLRSGDTAINADSINFFLNNTSRTAQSSSVAPGILTLSGLYTDGQVQMVMRGLAQRRGTDVMNAPSVIARPGETARIEVVRQFIYPTDYDPPQIPNNLGGNIGGNNNAAGTTTFSIVPITPATPTAFEERPTGVILEVTPDVGTGADKRTISLDLEPEIVEFEGFINYGSPIQAIGIDALGASTTITITENRIEMPVFSRRTVQTGLTLFDGHTVSIGGLMSEEVQKIEDKVPVLGDIPLLGRLFQSEAENRIKSNLVIFVKAEIVDAQGNKLYGAPGEGASSSSVLPPRN